MDHERLRSIPLFAGLSSRELETIGPLADEVDLEEGRELVREGEFAYEFFAIEDGSAEVRRGDERLAELAAGDFFGEMGVMAHVPRNASVVVTSPTTAIVMTAGALRQVARDMPEVAERIRAAIEERSRSLVEG